jgi:hypothetical protein
MARGWESKSVEEQMASAGEASGQPVDPASEENKRAIANHLAEVERKRQGLALMRENILSQKTRSPQRRMALQAALASIEAEIGRLGL